MSLQRTSCNDERLDAVVAGLARRQFGLITREQAVTLGATPAMIHHRYRWHAGKAQWANDLERRNILTAAGWRVLHITWQDLQGHPHRTVARIRAALNRPPA